MLDVKPIGQAVKDAESKLVELMEAADALEMTIEAEIRLRRDLKDAEQALDVAEAMFIYDAERATQEKDSPSPLSGIAKTSPVYKAAITRLLAMERQNPGAVSEHAQRVSRLRVQLDQAQIEREQAGVHFSACKHAADLKAAILRAMVL